MEANNMAAMREALALFIQLADDGVIQPRSVGEADEHCFCGLGNQARAALSAPPRNCDVGTAEGQSDRYEAHCDAYHKATGTCDDCPIYKEECKMTGNTPHCQLVWAQMPYEEGGAK